ncbi:MAG TPA: hypothetical protein VL921_05805 [Candidatus Udaeobacter sp.]|nr:hypothetical protein [Candidatus Udaeobacter sp.]
MLSQTINTKRQVLGQVIICSGCCCGRTDKGKPAIPEEWLKNNWKQGGLLRTIQLTISGCLGPCDLTNVISILTPQKQIWLGGITSQNQYEALLEWAQSSSDAGCLLDLPEILQAQQFERYKTS